jgi:hypothetical protein
MSLLVAVYFSVYPLLLRPAVRLCGSYNMHGHAHVGSSTVGAATELRQRTQTAAGKKARKGGERSSRGDHSPDSQVLHWRPSALSVPFAAGLAGRCQSGSHMVCLARRLLSGAPAQTRFKLLNGIAAGGGGGGDMI